VLLAGGLLCCELAAAFFAGPFGLRLQPGHYEQRANSEAVHRAIAMVPEGASVAAQSGLVPHLSQRQQIWEFPPAFKARYVVIDLRSWHESHGPPSPESDYDLAVRALPTTGYCLLFYEDGVQVWTLDACPAAAGAAIDDPARPSAGAMSQ